MFNPRVISTFLLTDSGVVLNDSTLLVRTQMENFNRTDTMTREEKAPEENYVKTNLIKRTETDLTIVLKLQIHF